MTPNRGIIEAQTPNKSILEEYEIQLWPMGKRYSIQIFKGTNGELTFKKSNRLQKRQNKTHTQYNIN